MNILGETFFMLQDLLVKGEKDSKNINMVLELVRCPNYNERGFPFEGSEKKKNSISV